MALNILLVPSPNIYRQAFAPYIPFGLLSLKAIACQFKTNVDVLIPDLEILNRKFFHTTDLAHAIFSGYNLNKYDIIGFSAVCNSIYHTLFFARYAKNMNPNAKIIIGGPYVTKLPLEIMETFPFIDAVFCGEGETSFSNLLERCDDGQIHFDGIQGVTTATWRGGQGPIVTDLDRLPEMSDFDGYLEWHRLCESAEGADRSIPLEASRGCPLQCSFCSTRQVWGARVRRKSARRLYRDMTYLSKIAGQRFFNLIGDNLGVPRAHFIEFCRSFADINKNEYIWGASLKLDRLSIEHLQISWRAGMRAMFVGVESGSQTTLDHVRKKTVVEAEIDNLSTAIDMGYKVDTSFIIGFPWENQKDIVDTYRLHCSLLKKGANRSQIGILCPIPGTKILEEAEFGFDQWSSYIAEDDISPNEELMGLIKRFPDLFSHMGHYRTPKLDRADIMAVRDAGARMAALHQRARMDRNRDWNSF